jgi:sugar O-acyltransferase (sialic acid O-acetyltransferase NeuD family)
MRRLALLGASGHGKVVADAALLAGWDEVVFFDDAWPDRAHNGPWPVMGTTQDLLGQLQRFDGVLIAIGNCSTRWAKHRELEAAGARMATVVHPAAVVSNFARLGSGTVVMAAAVVNASAEVDAACIINTGATVDHDCVLGPAVHVCPGAHVSGDVKIGACTWVGVGAAIKQGLTLGERVMVGAGAVVIRAVADDATVVGNPARVMG